MRLVSSYLTGGMMRAEAKKNGRASCRERGEISGGAGSLKKKKKKEQNTNGHMARGDASAGAAARGRQWHAATATDDVVTLGDLLVVTGLFFCFFQAEDGIRDKAT